MASSPNPKGIRMQKAQAMGMKPKMAGSGPSTPFAGTAGTSAIPGTSKKLPSSAPSKLAIKPPKGIK